MISGSFAIIILSPSLTRTRIPSPSQQLGNLTRFSSFVVVDDDDDNDVDYDDDDDNDDDDDDDDQYDNDDDDDKDDDDGASAGAIPGTPSDTPVIGA